jgi:hypothetical protein
MRKWSNGYADKACVPSLSVFCNAKTQARLSEIAREIQKKCAYCRSAGDGRLVNTGLCWEVVKRPNSTGNFMPTQRRQPALFSIDPDVDLLDVEDRKTDELVIGFVGPIGSGISYCANIFSG